MSLPKPSAPSTQSLIGVAVAVSGNVLISLALNCQKLAHQRLQKEWEEEHRRAADALAYDEEESDEDESDEQERVDETVDESFGSRQSPATERTALLRTSPESYRSTGLDGSTVVSTPDGALSPLRQGSEADGIGSDIAKGKAKASLQAIAAEAAVEAEGAHSDDGGHDVDHHDDESAPAKGTKFLRSKLWWLGIGLMVLGEGGNFISYGFAPASLVAPLGAVALLSNVLISPLLLHERFTLADVGGILLAIVGAVTVVFSSRQSDPRLSPGGLWKAIKRTEFIVWASVSAGIAVLLCIASTTRAGDKIVLIDVGVCAAFGAFTVLSTKAISSLLSSGNPLDMFRYPITYVLLFVLVSTAVLQITYLNRALQRFDSRQVIPTQFVMFTISAIVGSAVLYRDFEDVDAHRMVNFLFGCLTTFAGVFVLARRNGTAEHDEASATPRRRRRTRTPRHRRIAHRDEPGPVTESWTSSATVDSAIETTADEEGEDALSDEDEPSHASNTSHAQSIATPGSRKAAIRFDPHAPSPTRRSPWLKRPQPAETLPLAGGHSDTFLADARKKGGLRLPGSSPTSSAGADAEHLSRSVPAPVSPLSTSMSFVRTASRPVSGIADFPISTAAPTGLLSAGRYLLLPSLSTGATGQRSRSRQRSLSQPPTPTRKRSRRNLREAAAAQGPHQPERERERDLEANAVSSAEESDVDARTSRSRRSSDRRRSSGRKERPKSDLFESVGRRRGSASK